MKTFLFNELQYRHIEAICYLISEIKSYISNILFVCFQSSHFGNYEKNRGGFEKLYRKLSDQTWEQAIDLVKYVGKRGGHMNFRLRKDETIAKVLEFI